METDLKNALAAYLSSHIPLSGAMQAEILEASGEVVRVRIPLAPNINHRGTVFGGSASALAMLAGWGRVWTLLYAQQLRATIVIRRNTMEFDRPMPSAVTAVCHTPERIFLDGFFESLRSRGKARLTLPVMIYDEENRQACKFSGEFVVVGAQITVEKN